MAEKILNKFRLVMIGGSAGSLEILLKIVQDLPAQIPVSVIVVLHRKNSADSVLERLVASRTDMWVREVEDKDRLKPGGIFIAPPDYHLLLEADNSISLDTSAKLHFSRPSIDISFESAAEEFGNKVIGVLLSGANADGVKGLKAIAEAGGYTIVQTPQSAEVSFMPEQALREMEPDEVIDGAAIGKRLTELILDSPRQFS